MAFKLIVDNVAVLMFVNVLSEWLAWGARGTAQPHSGRARA